jgi:hypothetical protein
MVYSCTHSKLWYSGETWQRDRQLALPGAIQISVLFLGTPAMAHVSALLNSSSRALWSAQVPLSGCWEDQ